MATNYNITRTSDWEPSLENHEFKKASTNSHGSTSIGFNYKGSRTYLKTPKMRAPFGLGRGMDNKGYVIQLTFDKDNAPAADFLERCKQFDETMIQAGIDHAFEWGITQKKDKVPSREVVEDRYKPMVKYPRYPKNHPTKAREINPEYPPYIQVSLPESKPKEGEEAADEASDEVVDFLTELYNKNKELIPINEQTLGKHCQLTGLIYATSAYSSTTGFGVSWKAAQLMVFPKGGLPTGTCLIDDDVDDSSEEDASHEQVPEAGSVEAGSEPEQPESAPEPEPEPIVPAKKPVVGRKKN